MLDQWYIMCLMSSIYTFQNVLKSVVHKVFDLQSVIGNEGE